MGIRERNRKSQNRRTKPVWLIVFEGKNQTEKLYFGHFNYGRDSLINLVPIGAGNTDPTGIVEYAVLYAKNNEIGIQEDDRIICVIDVDLSEDRDDEILQLKKKYNDVEIYVSNPCFETWFLLHFVDYPKTSASSQKEKAMLRKYIPNYTESMDVYAKCTTISQDTNLAISRAERIRKSYQRDGKIIGAYDVSPYTEVDEIIGEIINNKK